MICKNEECFNPVENYDNGLCATHSRKNRKEIKKPKPFKRIKQMSDKQAGNIREYSRLKRDFFANPLNRICKVCGMNGADSIHHSKGKVGFADDWARGRCITLLNDVRYWIPIHSFYVNPEYGTTCHQYIEERPELARTMGVTKSRHNKH